MFNTLIYTNIYLCVYIYIFLGLYCISKRFGWTQIVVVFLMLRLFNIYVDVSRHT